MGEDIFDSRLRELQRNFGEGRVERNDQAIYDRVNRPNVIIRLTASSSTESKAGVSSALQYLESNFSASRSVELDTTPRHFDTTKTSYIPTVLADISTMGEPDFRKFVDYLRNSGLFPAIAGARIK